MEIYFEEFIIKNKSGYPMLTDIRYLKNLNELKNRKPIIIFSHGFKGFKDFGCFNLIADEFAKAGFVFLKFNFSLNGTTPEKPTEFLDLKAFSRNTFTQELEDLGDIIDEVCTEKFINNHPIDINQIFLIGHSMGGGISILKAYQDNRIKKLVTWASIFQFGKFWSQEMIDKWKIEGIRYEFNSRTKQQMPLKYLIYQDFIDNLEKLDIPIAVKNLEIPFRLIHGDKDETLPVAIINLFKEANENIDIQIVENANHTFGMMQPWKEIDIPKQSISLLEISIIFLLNNI
jgi:pimeloyl-ACP methyl ester carboxylesterase